MALAWLDYAIQRVEGVPMLYCGIIQLGSDYETDWFFN